MSASDEVIRNLGELIETLELLRDSLDRKVDAEKPFDILTDVLLQHIFLFGHDPGIMRKMFPFFQSMRENIETDNYEDAGLQALALLAKLRSARSGMVR